MLCSAQCARANDASLGSTNFASVSHAGANLYASKPAPRFTLDKSKVVVEADGSLTPKHESVVDVIAALESSVGVAVNFELVFAKNSTVLTADGEQTLAIIAESIRYLDSNIRVDVEMPNDAVRGKSFTERRGAEVVRLLRSRFNVRNPIHFFTTSSNAADNYHSIRSAPKGTDLSRITILNMGLVAEPS